MRQRLEWEVPAIGRRLSAGNRYESARNGQADNRRLSVIETHDAHSKALPTRLLHPRLPSDRVAENTLVCAGAHALNLFRVGLDPDPHPRD